MSESLAIIGTAGRHEDYKIIAQDPAFYYESMVRAANKVIEITKSDTLISGGAALADHVAITIFLKNPNKFKLILELPTNLIADEGDGLCFQDSGAKGDCGGIANYYHRQFTKLLRTSRGQVWSSFIDLKNAVINPNCIINITPGFKERNTKVAQRANHCLAMTFGQGRTLKDGGTKDTMAKFLAKPNHGKSFHLDLNMTKLWENANI